MGRRIIACRDETKGQGAVDTITRETGFKDVECWRLDQGSFESVKGFVERFEREGGGKLDVLLENAGIGTEQYRTTGDGFESTYVLYIPLLRSPRNTPPEWK